MIDNHQVIIEFLGRGPQSLPSIACELHKRGGVSTEQMCLIARNMIRDMMASKDIEQCGDGMNTCFRLTQ